MGQVDNSIPELRTVAQLGLVWAGRYVSCQSLRHNKKVSIQAVRCQALTLRRSGRRMREETPGPFTPSRHKAMWGTV